MELKPFSDFWSSERADSFAASFSKRLFDEAVENLKKAKNADIAVIETCALSSVRVSLEILREYHDWLSEQLSE